MQNFRSLLSILLSVMMLAGILPAAAFAKGYEMLPVIEAEYPAFDEDPVDVQPVSPEEIELPEQGQTIDIEQIEESADILGELQPAEEATAVDAALTVSTPRFTMSSDHKSVFITRPTVSGGSGHYTYAYNLYDNQNNAINYFYSSEPTVAATFPRNCTAVIIVVVSDGTTSKTVYTDWFTIDGYPVSELRVSDPEWTISADGKSIFIDRPTVSGGTGNYTYAYNIYDSNSNPVNYFYSSDARVAATPGYSGVFCVFIVVSDGLTSQTVRTDWLNIGEQVLSLGNNAVNLTAGNETRGKFVAPSSATYVFTSTTSKDVKGTLYNSSFTKLAEHDDISSDYNDYDFRIEYQLTSGQTVYLGVYLFSSEESGPVNVNICKKSVFSSFPLTPEFCEISIPANSELQRAFVAPSTGFYTFTTIGSDDTYGYLLDSSGTPLASDDDSGEGRNFSITYNLISGQEVYVVVRFCSISSARDVYLSVSRQLSLNTTTSIYLTPSFVSKFVAPSSGTYVFSSIGSENTIGRLLDLNRNTLAYDDDSGEDRNFSISYNLTSGQIVYICVSLQPSIPAKYATVMLNVSKN